jgi:hypothetical protein
MKKQNTNESCETQTETCSTTQENKLTTVKTVYARAAVVLLALNFCLTGYVVYNMNQTTQAQIDGITGATTETSQTTTQQTTTQASTTTEQTPQTTDTQTGQGETGSPVTTRGQ